MWRRDIAVVVCGVLVVACGRDQSRRPAPPDSVVARLPAPVDDPTVAPSAEPRRPPPPVDERWGVVPLVDGSRFQTTLYDLTVIGRLRTTAKQPYYLLAGRGCMDCDANIALYLHSPSDGPMGVEGEQARFPYPGHEMFYEDSTPLYEARTFFGDCAAAYRNAVLWFQQAPDVDGRWRASVRIAQVRNDSLIQATLLSGGPSLEEAIDAVAQGRCREVPGLDRTSEP